jgi:pSer/pThr/pTyr-binding forkhead associated (FHA) protein
VGKHTHHLGQVDTDAVALYVEDTSSPLVLRIDNQIVLGRYSPGSASQRPIDLEPFDAFEKGVSRLHAAIRRTHENDYVIVDLGSTNGTLVNGEPLTPHEPFKLRNGDLIRLGALNIYFYGATQ